MRSHIGWRGESRTKHSLKGYWEETSFKNLEWKPKKESLKRTISDSNGLGPFTCILCYVMLC